MFKAPRHILPGAFLFLALFLSCSATAAQPAQQTSGRELLRMCSSTYDTDYGFCAGFVSAVANVMLSGPVAGHSACRHAPVRSQQLIGIFQSYAEIFPEQMGQEAGSVVAAAVARAFPCN